jgi:hypothetical protein
MRWLPRKVRPDRAAPLGLALVVALAASPARAGDADPPAAPGAAPARVPEFLEMFWMIVTRGADMGPTDGWFHPAQSRYGWDWLRARDRDGDRAIAPEELGGPPESFRRLDRDRDGAIVAEDLDWSPDSAYVRRQAASRRRFLMMDTNSNGRVSQLEWDAFFARAAEGKGGLAPEDLDQALDPTPPAPPRSARPRPAAGGGPSRWTLLTGLFKGELGSRFEGPSVGDLAPDFTLRTNDGKREVTLSKFRGDRPVVLIFGSFT